VRKDVVFIVPIRSPPMGRDAMREAGTLIRALQEGEKLSLPQSRPMPSVGKGCHELRVGDVNQIWRVLYYVGDDIVILDVFSKKTRATPKENIKRAKTRLKLYRD